MIYRLYIIGEELGVTVPNAAMTGSEERTVSFLFTTANTDYQTFKAQINADEAQLEDADGNMMTAEEAKVYVSTLP